MIICLLFVLYYLLSCVFFAIFRGNLLIRVFDHWFSHLERQGDRINAFFGRAFRRKKPKSYADASTQTDVSEEA